MQMKEADTNFPGPQLQVKALLKLTEAAEIKLEKPIQDALTKYIELLLEENRHTNIISRNDLSRIGTRHIYESLLLTKVHDFTGRFRLLDIGSGGGFPAVVLKIYNPEIDLVMVESTGKKCRFLDNTVDTLDMSGVKIINGRAEELKNDRTLTHSFDVITARAVAELKTLLKYSGPLLKGKSGVCIFPKGSRVEDEARRVKRDLWNIEICSLTEFLDSKIINDQILNAAIIRKKKISKYHGQSKKTV